MAKRSKSESRGASVRAWTALPFHQEMLDQVVKPKILEASTTCEEMTEDGLRRHFCRFHGVEVSRPLWVLWLGILRIAIKPQYRLTVDGGEAHPAAPQPPVGRRGVPPTRTPQRSPKQPAEHSNPATILQSDPLPPDATDSDKSELKDFEANHGMPLTLIGDNGIPPMG